MSPAAPFANETIISWYRGEFAAANAIIDVLCGHLSSLEIDKCEYEGAFGAIHRRRLNWIHVSQMQKYCSIGDVVMELEKVTGAMSGSDC
nr:alpha-ketoglutarate-dependent dioxygenase AlkB-like protein [Tanacetum cinerariifolium]